MADNAYTYQVLKDTNQKTVIKLTGRMLAGTNESNSARISAKSLAYALDSSKANLLSSVSNTGPLSSYTLNLTKINYSIRK